MANNVVIAGNLKKVSEMFDAEGNQIDPVTRQIIKKKEVEEIVGIELPDAEFVALAESFGLKIGSKKAFKANGVSYIRKATE